MNVRKPVDYSSMFAALDTLMAEDLPQTELYCEIGQLVSGRPEKRRRCRRSGVPAGCVPWRLRVLSPEPAPDAGVLPHL